MKVLIPVDWSKYSDYAIKMVGAATWLNPTKIMLINVAQSIESFLPIDLHTEVMLKEQEEIGKRSKKLEEPIQYLKKCFPNCPSISSRIKFGNPKKVILNLIVKESFDFVVMGSHGRSSIERLILGSVSQAVLEHAPNAVLIAKPPSIDSNYLKPEFRKILVPYDGSVYSSDVISLLSQLSWSQGTKFHVVMAITDFERVEKLDLAPEYAAAVEKQWTTIKQGAFTILEDVALKLGTRVGNENVSIDAIAGPPREVVCQSIDNFQADLVALGSHGKSALDKVMLGSVSTYVTQHASCPVLIVKRLSGFYRADEENIEDDLPHESILKPDMEDRPPFTMF